MRKRKGFSLPEILVVVAIIGVLLPLLIWLYNSNYLIFHKTSKQQGIQEQIRACLNKMMIDVKSAYKIEKADDEGIKLIRFNGDTLSGKKIDTSAPPGIDYDLKKTITVEYKLETDKKDSNYMQITRLVDGKERKPDTCHYIKKEKGFNVVGLAPVDTGGGKYRFKVTKDVKNMAGISVYIHGEYLDASMKDDEQKLQIETRMFSPYLRNFLIYGYRDKPMFVEGGYFTNIKVMGNSGIYGEGNEDF